ncbi:MAG TPA: hypothetical protein VMT10_15135 [Solirubrobacteraceae bacterium]|nr:hypothetical protein [Solirubrobacteraceae bacterium]
MADAQVRLRPRDLLAALHRHDVEFVVIGAMSLAVHGYVRATKDLDVVPDPERPNLRRLAEALRSMDARVDLGDMDADELSLEPDEDALSGGGNWVLTTTFGRLDVMQDVPGLRDYKHLRGGAVEVNGTLYAGYDEVLSMKSAAGREEDLRDIAALKHARGE